MLGMFSCRRGKQWLSQGFGGNVLQEEGQIGDDTDAIAAGAVYGNDCFHPQLVLVRDVEQSRINHACRPLIPIEVARCSLKAELGDWDQAVYELGQAEVLNPGFEIRHV